MQTTGLHSSRYILCCRRRSTLAEHCTVYNRLRKLTTKAFVFGICETVSPVPPAAFTGLIKRCTVSLPPVERATGAGVVREEAVKFCHWRTDCGPLVRGVRRGWASLPDKCDLYR